MEGYKNLESNDKNGISIVDRIVETADNNDNRNVGLKNAAMNDFQLNFVKKPTIVPLDNKIRNRVLKVNDFFAQNKIANQQ